MRLTGLHVKGDNVVHIESRELSTSDIHNSANDTGSMGVTRCRLEALDGGLVPFLAAGVEDVEGVACLALCVLATKVYMQQM